MKSSLLLPALLSLPLACCQSSKPDGQAKQMDPPSADGEVRITLSPGGAPVTIKEENILRYHGGLHRFELDRASYDAFDQAGMGTPFVVSSGGVTIYSGVKWNPIAAVSHDGIVAMPLPPTTKSGGIVEMEKGYPSKDRFKGPIHLSDPRIVLRMKRLGKLVE